MTLESTRRPWCAAHARIRLGCTPCAAQRGPLAQVFDKYDLLGAKALPLYTWMTNQMPNRGKHMVKALPEVEFGGAEWRNM